MNIYIFVQERKSRKRGETKTLKVEQGAPPLPEGKKCGHAGLGIEGTVISKVRFSCLPSGLAFF